MHSFGNERKRYKFIFNGINSALVAIKSRANGR